MKIIYTTAEYQFPNALYLLKHVLLVVSILSFALKSPARFVDYNYRTIVELSALQRVAFCLHPHATVSKHSSLNYSVFK